MTEYKVLTLEIKMSAAKTAAILEEMLNSQAKQGWKLREMEGPFVVFEK